MSVEGHFNRGEKYESPVGGHISRIKLVSLCLKKAMVDAARLADELRAEQDHASAQASSKQSLNNQFGQLEARLSDAENAAARGGKSAMAKLENKVCLWTCFGINDLPT